MLGMDHSCTDVVAFWGLDSWMGKDRLSRGFFSKQGMRNSLQAPKKARHDDPGRFSGHFLR